MESRRTISYIGLWSLILPWLGLSWETKSVLFSLTGILLLVIGNRYYFIKKQKDLEKNSKPASAIVDEIKEPDQNLYSEQPAHSVDNTAYSYMVQVKENNIEKPKQVRSRRRVEMVTSRVKKEEPEYGKAQI